MAGPLPDILPVEVMAGGTVVTRIHFEGAKEPLFGPQVGAPPSHRFHDPLGKFHVCFAGRDETASFVETVLHKAPVRMVPWAELAFRHLSTFQLKRDVRLVSVHGPGLAQLGHTAEVTSSAPPYVDPQALARSLWEHGDEPDGIIYRCRHDNGLFAIALFDRPPDMLDLIKTEDLISDRARLLRWSKRYGFAIG